MTPEPAVMPVQPEPPILDVRYVADLARLDLSPAEAQRYGTQLADILGYVAQLQAVDVEGIEPTAHANPLVNVLRPDRCAPCLDRAAVLANAPAVVDDQFIKVPAVIDDET